MDQANLYLFGQCAQHQQKSISVFMGDGSSGRSSFRSHSFFKLFLNSRHTKFSSDRLFSLVVNDYKCEDVFTPDDLCHICSKFSSAHIEDGSNINQWISTLVNKYSELPGVRKFHDFLVVRTGSKIIMKV